MELTEQITHEWFRALLQDNCNWTNKYTKAFREQHAEEYLLLHSFYRIRSELYKDIDLMSLVGSLHWFTLTFDNKHDKSLVSSKRKLATRFLNDIFIVYEMVEEYGEDNGRYHIHGFGVFRANKGFKDFIKWKSRTKIQDLSPSTMRKKVKYLTKYAVKSLPRVRRSKSLCYLKKKTKTYKRLRSSFPDVFMERLQQDIVNMPTSFYNGVSKETNTQ